MKIEQQLIPIYNITVHENKMALNVDKSVGDKGHQYAMAMGLNRSVRFDPKLIVHRMGLSVLMT